MAPQGSGRKEEELLAPSAVSVSFFILIFTPPTLSELFSQLWCPNNCDFLFVLFGFGFVLQCWAWNQGFKNAREVFYLWAIAKSFCYFFLSLTELYNLALNSLCHLDRPWIFNPLASTSKVADKFQLPIKHSILEILEMVQPVKYKHEDLTFILQHPSETQGIHSVVHCSASVGEAEAGESLWACCPASLDKSVSSKFSERLCLKK